MKSSVVVELVHYIIMQSHTIACIGMLVIHAAMRVLYCCQHMCCYTSDSLPLQSLDRIVGISPKHQLSHTRDLKLKQVLHATAESMQLMFFIYTYCIVETECNIIIHWPPSCLMYLDRHFAKNYTSKMYKTVKMQTNLPVKICHLKV